MKGIQALWLFTLLCVFCGVAMSAACQEEEARRPARFLIPEGYVGWVRVNFNVKGAPPLPIEDGRYLFKFPSSGLLETSSDIEYGWARDEYFYHSGDSRRKLSISGWGEGGMIWGGATGWSGGNFAERTGVHKVIFVGTEEEFNKYGPLKDEDHNPRIGNVKTMAASNNGMHPTRVRLPVIDTLAVSASCSGGRCRALGRFRSEETQVGRWY